MKGRIAESVTTSALGWIGQLGKGPFFLFLNYFDPHYPYAPPVRHAVRPRYSR
jgi:hypothetical protein